VSSRPFVELGDGTAEGGDDDVGCGYPKMVDGLGVGRVWVVDDESVVSATQTATLQGLSQSNKRVPEPEKPKETFRVCTSIITRPDPSSQNKHISK
jgi:hypothetical protein